MGCGPSASSGIVVPVVNKLPPTAPTSVAVVVSSEALEITWSPPLFNGGLPASRYRVVVFVDATNASTVDVFRNSTQMSVSNLTNRVRVQTLRYLVMRCSLIGWCFVDACVAGSESLVLVDSLVWLRLVWLVRYRYYIPCIVELVWLMHM